MAASDNVHEVWWIGKVNYVIEGICLLLIVVPLVFAYRSMPQEDRFARGSDEGRYMEYAQAFAKDGVSSVSEGMSRYLDTPKLQQLPHPGRFGYTFLTGMWLKVFPDTYRSLAHFSFLATILFLVLSYYFSRRYLGVEVAVLYVLLLACSPLVMAASRRVLQDSVLNLFWALPFWFFFEYLMTKRRWAFTCFCITFVTALTIKEASFLLMFFFLASWLVFKFNYTKDLPWRDLGLLFVIPVFCTVVLYFIFLGGWGNFSGLLDFSFGVHLSGDASQGFTSYRQFTTGPWFKYLLDFLLLTPWVTVLCVGYVFYLLAVRRMGPVHAYGLLYLLIVYGLLSCLKHSMIVRFAMSLEIVSYLFAVLALLQLFCSKRPRNLWNYYAAALVVLLICYTQVKIYWKIFVDMRTYDSISPWLLVARKIIPFFKK